jgi:hypothetical protein
MLLSSLLATFSDKYTAHGDAELEVTTLESSKKFDSNFRSRAIFSNWFSEEESSRKDIMDKLLSRGFNNCLINIESDKWRISHARTLVISFSDGEDLLLRLDQGIGYWGRVLDYAKYPFDDTVEGQLEWVNSTGIRKSVKNEKDFPTYVFKSTVKSKLSESKNSLPAF